MYVDGFISMSSTYQAPSQNVLESFQNLYNGWISTPVPSDELMNMAITAWGADLDVSSDRRTLIKRDWKTRYNGAENVESIANCMNTRDDILDKLNKVKCPQAVLLIQGEMDTTWLVEEVEKIRDVFLDAELKVIRGRGHMLIFARPSNDINRMVEEFLNKLGY